MHHALAGCGRVPLDAGVVVTADAHDPMVYSSAKLNEAALQRRLPSWAVPVSSSHRGVLLQFPAAAMEKARDMPSSSEKSRSILTTSVVPFGAVRLSTPSGCERRRHPKLRLARPMYIRVWYCEYCVRKKNTIACREGFRDTCWVR